MKACPRLLLVALACVSLARGDARASIDAGVALQVSRATRVRSACTATARNTRLCLEASLQYRCFNYGNFSLLSPGPIRACNEAVTEMLDLIDVVQVPAEANPDDPVEKSGLKLKQVLFAHDLRAIFGRPELAGYFQAALAALQDSARFGRANNLWDAMQAHGYFNRRLSLRIIGQAVQDVSFGIWHLNYLDRVFAERKLAKHSVEMRNLRAAGEFIVLFQENLENGTPFSPYPAIRGLERDLHPYLHHFYLPAFIASELARRGRPPAQAFFAGFLLNAGYEFVKLDSKVGEARWPFHDPRPFDAEKHDLQARKIYTGYVGALWGLERADRAKPYAEFKRALAADPYGAMRDLFREEF